jgi:hypothetical protein
MDTPNDREVVIYEHAQLTCAEVARLGIQPRTVSRWADAGRLDCFADLGRTVQVEVTLSERVMATELVKSVKFTTEQVDHALLTLALNGGNTLKTARRLKGTTNIGVSTLGSGGGSYTRTATQR